MDPDLSRFEQIAQAARRRLPEPFRSASAEVVIQVRELPDAQMLRDLDMDDPMELTGLYDGIPLTEKSAFDQPGQPDIVWLFRKPILAEWHERGNEQLEHLIGHVLVHELAHHFGWDDDDIASVDAWWE